MKHSIKYITFVGLLATVAWFVKDPGWDSFAAALLTFAGFLSLDINITLAQREKETDVALYSKIVNELPSTGTIKFLRDFDFGGSFKLESLNQLINFVERWGGPEFRFHDAEIEKSKNGLYDASKNFMNGIAQSTSSKSNGTQSLPTSAALFDQPRYQELRKSLNDQANEVVQKHEQFIIRCKAKLKV